MGTGKEEFYCWWKTSCTTWDVWNSKKKEIFTISTGDRRISSLRAHDDSTWSFLTKPRFETNQKQDILQFESTKLTTFWCENSATEKYSWGDAFVGFSEVKYLMNKLYLDYPRLLQVGNIYPFFMW